MTIRSRRYRAQQATALLLAASFTFGSVPVWAQAPAEEEAAKPAAAAAPPPVAAAATPAASGAGDLIEVALSDGRIETFVLQFNSASSRKLSIYGKVAEQRVTVFADNEPAESILNNVANSKGWVWWREDNGDYGLADKEYYERTVLPKRVIQKVFRPNNIKASELDRAIKGLLTPNNVGSSVADDRTNKLIVNDLPPALERIERFIREIDVQLIFRVFYIRRANVEDIAKKLEQYKSGPGTIEVDAKTRQIIVTDLLSNIKRMELLVDILDVGPEIVQYDINNIGIDGEDLEGLQKIIDTIRTSKDLLFEVNAKQGVMILEDVPEVHERVEQILEEFDKPVRQVLLQSEIISTLFSRNFSFGLTQMGWADDLLAAARQGALGAGPSTDTGGGFLGARTGSGANFTDTGSIFPNVSQSGGTVTGNYLSSTVFFQYQAVYNDSSSRVLLQPRLLVKNQAKSTIFVGEEVPYLTSFYDNSGNNNNSSSTRTTTQSTVQSGLKFEVTPSISNSYLVELELKIDNDRANPTTIKDGNNEVRVVGRDRQNVETTLQIPSGQTRMLGGLIRNNDSDGNAGLPFLVSLPIVGSLFGVKSTAREASNLMLFITPTIVEDESPRSLNKDGRRGRSLTNYERVPGGLELELDKEGEDPTAEIGGSGPPEELLSGNSQEEADELEFLNREREARNKRLEDEQAGNYVPGAGFGSATLNTGDAGAATGAPPAASNPTPPPSSAGNPGNAAQNPPANPQPTPPTEGAGVPRAVQRSETIYR